MDNPYSNSKKTSKKRIEILLNHLGATTNSPVIQRKPQKRGLKSIRTYKIKNFKSEEFKENLKKED